MAVSKEKKISKKRKQLALSSASFGCGRSRRASRKSWRGGLCILVNNYCLFPTLFCPNHMYCPWCNRVKSILPCCQNEKCSKCKEWKMWSNPKRLSQRICLFQLIIVLIEKCPRLSFESLLGVIIAYLLDFPVGRMTTLLLTKLTFL